MRRLVPGLGTVTLAAALALAVIPSSIAEQKAHKGAKAAAPAPAAATAPMPAMPGVEQLLYLIRSTLLTLNDANRSGNYTVMRDLAAPDFQARNSAAELAVIFSDLRRRNFDLFAAALMAPQLTTSPAIDARGMLHVAGIAVTTPTVAPVQAQALPSSQPVAKSESAPSWVASTTVPLPKSAPARTP